MYEERIANAIAALVATLASEMATKKIDRNDALEAILAHIKTIYEAGSVKKSKR